MELPYTCYLILNELELVKREEILVYSHVLIVTFTLSTLLPRPTLFMCIFSFSLSIATADVKCSKHTSGVASGINQLLMKYQKLSCLSGRWGVGGGVAGTSKCYEVGIMIATERTLVAVISTTFFVTS